MFQDSSRCAPGVALAYLEAQRLNGLLVPRFLPSPEVGQHPMLTKHLLPKGFVIDDPETIEFQGIKG